MTTATGLARVTVSAPQRRLDVALPEHLPLAELLPELLRHAGEGLPLQGKENLLLTAHLVPVLME